MQSANDDDVFNHEVAKRSVARAALHLGIETMSEEALDVMGDVLLTYLQRVGNVVSKMVESSGRTSAHANVLDAVRAIPVVTSPAAVHQLHIMNNDGDEQNAAATVAPSPDGVAWKDLAVFLFGKDWMQQKKQTTVQPEAGGKVGPSAVSRKNKEEQGWHAPYLDELPSYPQASRACANPHSLDSKEAESLYGVMPSPTHDAQATLLEEMPDEAFTTEWGSVKASSKKKADKDHEDAPPAKRARLQDGKAAGVEESKKDDKPSEEQKKPHAKTDSRPAYVPSFLPPFPTAGPGRAVAVGDNVPVLSSTAVAAAPATNKTPASSSTSTDVRSSLVKMSEPQTSYWGSGWDTAQPNVPEGRHPPKDVVKAAKKREMEERSKVQPLDKPSINRSSRIIEGSMDAAH